MRTKRLIYNIGINDIKGSASKRNVMVNKAYNVWIDMLRRCYSKKSLNYKFYGAKGVYVCDEWHTFSNFLEWFKENYKTGCALDKDKSGLGYYSPKSCQFITISENSKESCSRKDYSKYVGENANNFKPKEHYETYAVKRGDFKSSCKVKNWDFYDFKEVDSGLLCGKNKKYYYFYDPDGRTNRINSILPITDKYKNTPTQRGNFKDFCKRNGLVYDDFEEIFSGQKSGAKRLYLYTYKHNLEGK